MKVYIAVDLEGVTGIVSFERQAKPGCSGYQEARRLLMSDLNATIDGALEGGATDILIYDLHCYGLNIKLEEVNPKVQVIIGRPPLGFSSIFSLGDVGQGLIMIGCHAMAGTQNAVLPHTYDLKEGNLLLNDKPIGEIGMETLLAGEVGIPVIMVSGDLKAVEEARIFLSEIETAVVKEAIGKNEAKCFPPAVTNRLIREKTLKAVRNIDKFKPFTIPPPIKLKVENDERLIVEKITYAKVEWAGEKAVIIKENSVRKAWEIYHNIRC